jgi:hypothetical protein
MDEFHSTITLCVACGVMMGVLIFRIIEKVKLGRVDDLIACETGGLAVCVLLLPIMKPAVDFSSCCQAMGLCLFLPIGAIGAVIILRLGTGQSLRMRNPFKHP